MGQKTQPIGFRLGINRTWDSRWFGGKSYADLLHQDIGLRKYLFEKLKSAAVSKIVIERPAGRARISIYAGRPGLVIGKKGQDIETLKQTLGKQIDAEVSLNIIEVRKPELDAKLVADGIAQQLEKRVAFRRAMKRAVQNSMRLGAGGVRINCAGRLGGAEIARTEWLYDTKISVGPPFYNLVIGPIIVPFLILMAIGPKINWIKEKYKVLKSLILVIIISCILNLIIFYFFRGYNFISNLIIISSLFLIFSSIKDFILSKKNNSFLNVSSFISHLGFGTLIFFIILNHNFSKDFDLNIKVGETKKIENIEIKFQSLNIENRKNYNAIVGNFNIYNLKKNYQRILKPEIRVYDKPETLTFETAINSNFKRDLYLTMSNIDGSEFYNVKFQMKPFMLLIWLAAFLTASGGLIRIFIKK